MREGQQTAPRGASTHSLWLSRAALSFVALAAVMGWGASFVGLHAYGQGQMVGFSYWTAWLVPGTFDGAAFGATLITYRASIYGRSAVRGRLLMWSFTAISSWINWIHQVSPQAQIVAAGLPIAAVAVFDVVLAEMRADFEERHGKRRLRLRPGLLALRWIVDRTGTSGAFRQQVTDIPVSEIAGLATQNVEDSRSVFDGVPAIVTTPADETRFPGSRDGTATGAGEADADKTGAAKSESVKTQSAKTGPVADTAGTSAAEIPAPQADPDSPHPAAHPAAERPSAAQDTSWSRASVSDERNPEARAQTPPPFAQDSTSQPRTSQPGATEPGATQPGPFEAGSDEQDELPEEQDRSGTPTGTAAEAADAPTITLPPVPASPLSELSDEDKRTFARRDYRLSLDTGAPLTGADLGRRYGYSERWGRRQIAAVRVEERAEGGIEDTSDQEESLSSPAQAHDDSDDGASQRHLVALRD